MPGVPHDRTKSFRTNTKHEHSRKEVKELKFGRFTQAGRVNPIWGIVDLEEEVVRIFDPPFEIWANQFMETGPDALQTTSTEELANLTALAPLPPGARIFGAGANYMSHLSAMGWESPPESPVGYLKVDSAIIGPDAEIRYPSMTEQLDYEVELVPVVGRRSGEPVGIESILGYTIGNDVSVRDLPQPLGGPDLYSMKAFDGISPLGPWIVTADEVGGAIQPALDMMLRINGKERQRDNTGNMIFPVEQILSYINERNALRTGDIIYTGSCVGAGIETGDFLNHADLVEAEIEGLGILRNRVGHKTES